MDHCLKVSTPNPTSTKTSHNKAFVGRPHSGNKRSLPVIVTLITRLGAMRGSCIRKLPSCNQQTWTPTKIFQKLPTPPPPNPYQRPLPRHQHITPPPPPPLDGTCWNETKNSGKLQLNSCQFVSGVSKYFWSTQYYSYMTLLYAC